MSDIATISGGVAISAAWRAQELSPIALRPDLAVGLPLSIARVERDSQRLNPSAIKIYVETRACQAPAGVGTSTQADPAIGTQIRSHALRPLAMSASARRLTPYLLCLQRNPSLQAIQEFPFVFGPGVNETLGRGVVAQFMLDRQALPTPISMFRQWRRELVVSQP